MLYAFGLAFVADGQGQMPYSGVCLPLADGLASVSPAIMICVWSCTEAGVCLCPSDVVYTVVCRIHVVFSEFFVGICRDYVYFCEKKKGKADGRSSDSSCNPVCSALNVALSDARRLSSSDLSPCIYASPKVLRTIDGHQPAFACFASADVGYRCGRMVLSAVVRLGFISLCGGCFSGSCLFSCGARR